MQVTQKPVTKSSKESADLHYTQVEAAFAEAFGPRRNQVTQSLIENGHGRFALADPIFLRASDGCTTL